MDNLQSQVTELIEKGEFQQALQILESHGPENFPNDLNLMYSRVLLMLGNYSKSKDVSYQLYQEEKIDNKFRIQAGYIAATALNADGSFQEALQILKTEEPNLSVFTNSKDSKDLLRAGEIYNRIGTIHVNLGDFDQALSYYNKSLNILKNLDNPEAQASTLYNMGSLSMQMGKTDLAEQYLSKTLKIFRSINDKSGIAFACMELGGVYQSQGELEKALKLFIESNKIYAELGNQQHIAWSYTDLGNIYQKLGDIDRSLEYYSQAGQLYQQFNDQRTLANNLRSMATSYRMKGEWDEAQKLNEKALKLYELIGNRPYQARAMFQLGLDHYTQGNKERALEYLLQAQSFFEGERNWDQLAEVYFHLIQIYYPQNLEKTKELFGKLLAIDKEADSKLISLLVTISDALLSLEDPNISLVSRVDLLQSILKQPIVNMQYTVIAAMTSVRLSIREFENNKVPAILTNIEDLINNLYGLANTQNSISLKLRTGIFDAVLQLLQNKLPNYISKLNEVKLEGKEKGLSVISTEADWLLNHVNQNRYEIEENLTQSGDLEKVMHFSGLHEYFSTNHASEMSE